MELKVRNVNQAFKQLVHIFHSEGCHPDHSSHDVQIVKKSSGNGDVLLMIDEPVLITYTNPLERCLFSEARDVNPFSVLYESLYCLAGRDDVAPLAYYTKRMGEFSDDGRTFNGAYGYRWKGTNNHWFVDDEDNSRGGYAQLDQLKVIISHLKEKPDSRRAVLQMWNVEDDLLKVDTSVDVCCNLSVMFSLQQCKGISTPTDDFLDITVVNRSNDLVWGLTNVNYVQFSILAEYIAAHLGVQVGLYRHFTNNLHVYEKTWEPEKWLSDKMYSSCHSWSKNIRPSETLIQLVQSPEVFDKEVIDFVEHHSRLQEMPKQFTEPFLQDVARPMCNAFHCYKANAMQGALNWLQECKADDWRLVSENWIKRRIQRRKVDNA